MVGIVIGLLVAMLLSGLAVVFSDDMMADLVNEVATRLLVEFTDTTTTNFASQMGEYVKNSIGLAILGVVLVIMIIVLYIKFFKFGAELFIMRIFFPIACIGLIDSDKGMFAPYIKNFIKVACTVVVQLLCLKMAMWFMTNLHLIWAIAFCLMASSTPKLMDMILVSNGGGGLGTAVNNVYHVKGLASTFMKKW